MITSFFGILGWIVFLGSLPLVLIAFLTTSPNLGMVSMLTGAGALAVVCLSLITKGLVLIFRWQPTTRN